VVDPLLAQFASVPDVVVVVRVPAVDDHVTRLEHLGHGTDGL